jgi:Flp pilus assembly protein TadD
MRRNGRLNKNSRRQWSSKGPRPPPSTNRRNTNNSRTKITERRPTSAPMHRRIVSTATNGRQNQTTVQRPTTAGTKRTVYNDLRIHRSTGKVNHNSASSTPLFVEASKQERTNNTSASLPILEEELELRPVNPRLPAGGRNSTYFFLLGYQHRLRGNFASAVVACTRSINADPNDYRPYINRAYALSRIGRDNHALADLVTATNIAPHVPEIFYNLGVYYQSRSYHKKAIPCFTKALHLLSQKLCPPWTSDRRLDASMYLLIRKATYKSRALSYRQERQYHNAALDMIKCGGSTLKAFPNGVTGSYDAAVRKGTATYFDCGELFREREDRVDVNVEERVNTIVEEDDDDGKDDGNDEHDDGHDEEMVKEVVDEVGEEALASDEVNKNLTKKVTSLSSSVWDQLADSNKPLTESEIDSLVDVISKVQMLSHLPNRHLRRYENIFCCCCCFDRN